MYVCICNALNERRVRSALESGARTVSALYSQNGCRPQCGKCVPVMCRILSEHREASRHDASLPGVAAATA